MWWERHYRYDYSLQVLKWKVTVKLMTRKLFQTCFVTYYELNSLCSLRWQSWHVLHWIKWDVKDWASRVREFPLQMIAAELLRQGFLFVRHLDKHTNRDCFQTVSASEGPTQMRTQEDAGCSPSNSDCIVKFPMKHWLTVIGLFKRRIQCLCAWQHTYTHTEHCSGRIFWTLLIIILR